MNEGGCRVVRRANKLLFRNKIKKKLEEKRVTIQSQWIICFYFILKKMNERNFKVNYKSNKIQ